MFLAASDVDSKPEENKIAILLNVIGDEALELYNTFPINADEQKSLAKIKKCFEDYCSPKKNVIFERFKFNSIVQKEAQPFDNFVTELRKAVQSTEYPEPDSMVRDRIVMGIFDKTTQERLLREPNLTLERSINFCRAVEISKSQSKALQNEAEISYVKSNVRKTNNEEKPCRACGYNHPPRKCPAIRKTCAKCQGQNHFAKMCKKGKNFQTGKEDKRKKVDEVTREKNEEGSSSECDYYIDSIDKCIGSVNGSLGVKMWTKKVFINEQPIEFKLDTGAEVSVLPLKILKQISPTSKAKESRVSLVSYGSHKFKLETIGEITLLCRAQDKAIPITFIVVKTDNKIPLLGLADCLKLNLVYRVDSVDVNFKSVDQVLKSYHSVFEGLGSFPGEYHITLKDNVSPNLTPIRRVPQILHERLKAKLLELESKGIIRKVE